MQGVHYFRLSERHNLFYVAEHIGSGGLVFGDLEMFDLFVDLGSFKVMREKAVVKMKLGAVHYVAVGSNDLEQLDPNTPVRKVVTN